MPNISDRKVTGDGPKAVDPVWQAVRHEAQVAIDNDPVMATFIYSTILSQDSLEDAVIHRMAARLSGNDVSADTIRQSYENMLEDWPEWSNTLRIDIAAVYDRDPACDRFITPILYFKGFHALQCHRLANWSYKQGKNDFALYLQSRSSQIFQVDIMPPARLGKGIFMDHATGVVIGSTAVVGDDCSIMHGVTLGGTGKEGGDRHPKIGNCVLIGAGASVLGNISVGDCSRIAAGSLVLKNIPKNVTVAGIPGKVVGVAGCAEPSRTMNQIITEDF